MFIFGYLRPDEAWRLEFGDVTVVDDEDLGKTILKIEVRGSEWGEISQELQEYAGSREALTATSQPSSPGAH